MAVQDKGPSFLDEIQAKLEDTSGALMSNSDSDDCSDEIELAARKDTSPQRKCSGVGGCGDLFPSDQKGAEYVCVIIYKLISFFTFRT